MSVADLFAYVATALGLITFTPQVIRAWKTKNTKDLSIMTYSLLTIATLLWVVYGFLNHAFPIVLANVVVGAHAFSLVILKKKYG